MSPTTSTIVAVPESRVDSSIYRGPLQACRVFCQRLGPNAITFRKKTGQILATPKCASLGRPTGRTVSRGRRAECIRASRIRDRPGVDGKFFAQDLATSLPIERSIRKCAVSQKEQETSLQGSPSTGR